MVFQFGHAHHILEFLFDDLFVHFDFGEPKSDIVLDEFFIQFLELQRQQLDPLILDVFQEVQPMAGNFIQLQHCGVLIHLLLA